MPKPNRVVSTEEFKLVEAHKEIDQLRLAITKARCALAACKGNWANDWSGHLIADAHKVLTDAF